MAAICMAVALLAGAASAAGVFLRGRGATGTATSLRGETFRYATDGIYAWNAKRLVEEGVGWDRLSLFLMAPALAVLSVLVARGSLRGRLLGIGILAYFFYQYFEYALGWAFGPLFLLFIAIFALSASGIAWIASSVELRSLPERFSSRFPRKGIATLCFAVSFALVFVMWLPLVIRTMGGAVEGALLGQTTLVVQAFDLGIVAPLATFVGIAVLRRRPIGYLLASAFAVKAFAMAAAIVAMLLSAWGYEGRVEVLPLTLFAATAILSAVLLFNIQASIMPANGASTQEDSSW
jgi:hypothetical protein